MRLKKRAAFYFSDKKLLQRLIFIFCTGASGIFLFFAEKTLDFFAFFRYYILRGGKYSAKTNGGKCRQGKREKRMASFSVSFGKQHIEILSW
jgi:hypothetical protein